jgi:hypothetical protein
MACSLGLSLGGLAICAGQSNDRANAPVNPPTPQMTDPPPILLPVPPKPALPAAAPETLPPVPTPAREIEVDIPSVLPIQAIQQVPMVVVPDGGTVQGGRVYPPAPPGVDLPMTGPYPVGVPERSPMPREAPALSAPKSPEMPPMELRAETPPVPAPRAPEMLPAIPPPSLPPDPPTARVTPPAVPVELPTRNVNQPAPVAPLAPPPLPPRDRAPDLTPLPPVPPSADLRPVPQPQLAVTTSKLKMLMRLGDGKPRFEIRNSESLELLFKVYGEKVEMQSPPEGAKASPIAGVTAVGKVRFTGPMIEGTCDQVTVLSGTGEVLLKGNVYVRTKRGKMWSEMTTEKMIYQIGASALIAPTAPNAVQPTLYQQAR